MIRIYVDTGGYMPQLKDLVARGLAECFGADIDQHAYTNRRGLKVQATLETWEKDSQTWEEDNDTWQDEDNASHQYIALRRLIQQPADVRHMDTAYRNACRVFLTSDKGDIWRHREELRSLLGLQVMHAASEMSELAHLCESEAAINPGLEDQHGCKT
jgi:hypothetical protein